MILGPENRLRRSLPRAAHQRHRSLSATERPQRGTHGRPRDPQPLPARSPSVPIHASEARAFPGPAGNHDEQGTNLLDEGSWPSVAEQRAIKSRQDLHPKTAPLARDFATLARDLAHGRTCAPKGRRRSHAWAFVARRSPAGAKGSLGGRLRCRVRPLQAVVLTGRAARPHCRV